MKLGTKIKELRKKEGLTQVDLSEKSGLSLRTIQRIENDENKPSVYSLRMIGEVLNYKFNLKKFNIMRNIFEKENRKLFTPDIWTNFRFNRRVFLLFKSIRQLC